MVVTDMSTNWTKVINGIVYICGFLRCRFIYVDLVCSLCSELSIDFKYDLQRYQDSQSFVLYSDIQFINAVLYLLYFHYRHKDMTYVLKTKCWRISLVKSSCLCRLLHLSDQWITIKREYYPATMHARPVEVITMISQQ